VAAAVFAAAIVSTTLFDPLADKACPQAVDHGADCARYGVAGRVYSELLLLKVDGELGKAEWAAAKADLTSLLQVRPNFTFALADRGDAEAGLGATAAALADYDRVLTRSPDDLRTRARRGQVYQSLGKTKQAAADFAFVYHADASAERRDEVVAFVRQIDHSTSPAKVHKAPKRPHRPSADAAQPAEPSPQTEPPGDT
jgi:tetratricopeptide (TPR) repeat protein